MTAQLAFTIAGAIGIAVSLAHGILMQTKIIVPLLQAAETTKPLAGSTRRLFVALMHFSTLGWFLGGLGLIAAAQYFDSQIVTTVAVVTLIMYSIGTAVNFWGTRGKHPGWVLLAISSGLIIYGLMA